MSISVLAILQLVATLFLLANGNYQYGVGNDYIIGMSQSTISKYVNNFVQELEGKLCPALINFDPENSYEYTGAFMKKYKFPGGQYIRYLLLKLQNASFLIVVIFA